MIGVRVGVESELGLLISTFPDDVGRPVDRHSERFALQRTGDITYLIAWDGEVPIGYVFVRWPGRAAGGLTQQARTLGCAELADLHVAPAARGRGAGRLLVEAAESLVRGRGVGRLGLEVTVANPHNDVARGLYARRGYKDAGFGEFVSGYTYWDPAGNPHRDEELYRYLVKQL